MDAFTDIAYIFASTSESDTDASTPIDEEAASKGAGAYFYCVIAWNASIPRRIFDDCNALSFHPRMSSFKLLKNNNLLTSSLRNVLSDASIIIMVNIATTHTWHNIFRSIYRHEPLITFFFITASGNS